jgi:hypothetical protein
MNTLIVEQDVLPIKCKRTENEELSFENKWQHSISGDDFVQKTHEHLKNLYAAGNKRQNGSKVL